MFDCAFKARKGSRSIEPIEHIRMMGAVQPFLSGAISKTVNVPNDASVQDVQDIYVEAWRLGLKAVAIYRDGCKRSQPLNTGESAEKDTALDASGLLVGQPVRRRLPADCQSLRHKFDVAGHEGYIHVGFYEDGTPGELFIKMAKEGSTISGLMDTIATLTSLSLQYGVPLDALVKKFAHVRYEPSGFTKNPDIPMAKSLTDYIFRFLGSRTVSSRRVVAEDDSSASAESPAAVAPATDAGEDRPGLRVVDGGVDAEAKATDMILTQEDAPSCAGCGSIMIRNGACYKCLNCGETSGCS